MTTPTDETPIPCRRCSECTGQEHHWLSEPDLQDDEKDFEEGVNDYVYQCKHCPATRPYDPDEDDDYGDELDDDDLSEQLDREERARFADAADVRQLHIMVEEHDFGGKR